MANASTMLTAAAIERYRPQAKRRVIRDAGARSLFLIVAPSGAKSWQMRFRIGGRIGKLTLGPVDFSGKELTGTPVIGMPLTLSAARLLSAEVLRTRALGQDPVADHKVRKRQTLQIADDTFAAAAKEFILEYKSKKKGRRPRRWKAVASCLGYVLKPGDDVELIKHGLADKWSSKPVKQITEDDLFVVVRAAQQHGIPGLARRVKGNSDSRGRKLADALSGLFKWLKQERRIPLNPMHDVEWKPPAGGRRPRRLTDDELRWLWLALDKADEIPTVYANMIKFIAVTAARRDEARLMQQQEITGTDWIVPAGRMKGDQEHLVPLSTLAREILKATPRVAGSKLMFTLDGTHPLGAMSKWKRALDAAMLKLAKVEQGGEATIPGWMLHDLRRNARTFLSRVTSSDIAERILSHKIGGVRGHYDLYEYADEKAAGLQLWAREIERIVAGRAAKVLPLRRRSK